MTFDSTKIPGGLFIERMRIHRATHDRPFDDLLPFVFFCSLQWDEAKFGGTKVLRVYPGDIWLPDIELYNTKVRL